MTSYLALQTALVLLQSNVFLRNVRGSAENGRGDGKTFADQEELKNLGIRTVDNWEVVCEGENLSLMCAAGEVLKIMDAEYGRNDGTTCALYPNFNNTKCLSHQDAFYRVRLRCHNKRRCSMKSSNDEFGDPCPSMIKYLKVKYACEQVKTAIRESVTLCESDQQRIGCKKGTSLIITDALYGRSDTITCCCRLMNDTDCKAKYALDIVSARCDYKEICDLEASNTIFGDPCIGTIKYLEVNYLCLPDKVQLVRNCERQTINLECQENSFINVLNAHYGRADPFVCFQNQTPFLKQGCGSAEVTSSVKERCQGKSICTLPASNEIFGDPCIGYTKHLDVEYSCSEIVPVAT